MMRILKVVSVLVIIFLLFISIAGCNAENTAPVTTAPASIPPATTPATTPPVYGEPGTTKSLEGYGNALYAIKVTPSQLWVAPNSESLFTVMAIYEDNRKVEVTKDCTYKPWSKDVTAHVISRDTGWYVVAGQSGTDVIIVSYTDKGVSLSTSITITVGDKPLADKPQPKL